MTKKEAKRYVCRVAARLLAQQMEAGAHWIYYDEDVPTERDVDRVETAIEELAEELKRRARRRR